MVLWAAMPEAAINEHRYSVTGEYQVRGTPESRQWPSIHPVSKPHGVHEAANSHLRTRVSGSVALH